MKDNKNWEKLNNQLKNMVEDVLDRDNIKDLGEQMTKTVNAALSEASSQLQKTAGDLKSAGQSVLKDIGTEIKKPAQPDPHKEISHHQRTPAEKIKSDISQKTQSLTNNAREHFQISSQRPKRPLPAFRMRRIGSVSGPMLIMLGCVGYGATFYSLMMGFIALRPEGLFALMMRIIICSALFLLSTSLTLIGSAKRKRFKRALWYTKICNNRPYINIEDLAKHTSQKPKFILKDLKKMLKIGIFPEGHLDTQQTCIMLNQNIYSQYLTLEKERHIRELEESSIKQNAQTNLSDKTQSAEGQAADHAASSELELLAAQGQAYIQNLQKLNDEIEGEIISTKLFKLENLIREIFERIGSQPQQIPKIQRFMDYYLPTSLKLVQAYRDFDKVSVPGEDIISAKSEIENTLDTINQAFGELLNNLFRDVVYDVTTDAKVLQSMLAREGLTEDLTKASPTVTEL